VVDIKAPLDAFANGVQDPRPALVRSNAHVALQSIMPRGNRPYMKIMNFIHAGH